MKLTTTNKQEIVVALQTYVARFTSQNKAAASLQGTSAGTISQMLSGKWERISDEMWRKVASQVAPTPSSEGWQIVSTTSFNQIAFVLNDAQENQNCTWAVGDAGCGKTTTARHYAATHSEVFTVLCSEDMKRSDFLREIARQMGVRITGYNLREMLEMLIAELIKMRQPLLVFDEADKLTDRVFHYFITLYNRLEEYCGIVFLSTSYIKRRIATGLRSDRRGYAEMHSRMGRKFFNIDATTPADVCAICMANGIVDKTQVAHVIKDTEAFDFDLRRVKKVVKINRKEC